MAFFFSKTLFFRTKKFFMQKNFLVLKNRVFEKKRPFFLAFFQFGGNKKNTFHTVCEFYDCQTIVYDITIFWIWKKKNGKNSQKLPFFFSNSKYCDIVHNGWQSSNSQTVCILGSKLKICGRNCHKNQHLLIFDDFGKFFWFLAKFGVFQGSFVGF